MRMYIPQIGDVIQLTEDWEFNLHHENRNKDLLVEFFNFDKVKYIPYIENNKFNSFKLLKNTILTIDRIYIRKGNDDFSSLTFNAIFPNGFKGRFWAKLEDVNNIEFDIMKIKDINNKFTSFIQKIEITTIDKLDINKPKFKDVDVFFPSYYKNEDKHICTEFTCQFENDNDKVTLNMNKKVYNSKAIVYSYTLEYLSINEITKRKEKKSIGDTLVLNSKPNYLNANQNINLINKFIEIYEDSFNNR